jgi:hypothetical protein
MSEAACIGIEFALTINEANKKKRKKYWMKEWFKKRAEFTHENLLKELELTAPSDYKKFMRM